MSDLSDIFTGIKTTLEAANASLTVYTSPPASINTSPAMVLEPTVTVDYNVDFGQGTWAIDIPCTLYVVHGDPGVAWSELHKFLSPTGTESIVGGVRTDTTLGGSVDTAFVSDNLQVTRDLDTDGSFMRYAARFNLRVWETL